MAKHSLTASPIGIQKAKTALIGLKLTQQQLADRLVVTRQPINKFFNGKPIKPEIFVSICEHLKLDWEEIAKENHDVVKDQPNNINSLVYEVKKYLHKYIETHYGKIRILNMQEAISLDDIFIKVKILEKITANRGINIKELNHKYRKDFDRSGLISGIRQSKVPALEAVERFQKLMVLGKPGSGKTTFLKRLARQCSLGEFCKEKVPVFITLREVVETNKRSDLLSFIEQQWQSCNVSNPKENAETLLHEGRMLVLLDGLDEVREQDYDQVRQAIEAFTKRFWQSYFVITRRIASREDKFEAFKEVEIADFSEQQIFQFSRKWFSDQAQAKKFEHKLRENQPIRELASSPLLLTLLCLVFQEDGDFPEDRSELYKDGLDVLLKKWDASRYIERDEQYRKLSLRHKEDLLSYIAYKTFKKGEYFFKQNTVEELIQDYIVNMPGFNADEQGLKEDSEVVLNSMEAQHGLLVRQARKVYSFSHLTFQEYFTARQISDNCNSSLPRPRTLQELVKHLLDRRWREVFLLTTTMLRNADRFLLMIKQETDSLLKDDPKLQDFFGWVKKSQNLFR
jgi:predicted NACHT family NTPase